MLLGAVLLWALNVTVTKYMFEHGWQPLAYGTIRYFAAISLFWIFTFRREGSFRIAREDWHLVAIAAAMIFCNQIAFVYSLEFAQASTVALLFGTTPVFVAIVSLAFRLEKLTRAFWVGAALTFAGVALVARRRRRRLRLGDEGQPHRDLHRADVGVLHGRDRAAHAEVLAVPDQRRRARDRLGAARARLDPADLAAVVPLLRPDLARLRVRGRRPALPHEHPLVHGRLAGRRRRGPSIFNNLQPFFGVLFALLLLSESLQPLEIAGGVLIFVGIYLERRLRHRADCGSRCS